jgi:hypothetical protein
MQFRLRRHAQRDSRTEARESLREARAETEKLSRWRPVRGSDQARAELDHAVRRFYGDGS